MYCGCSRHPGRGATRRGDKGRNDRKFLEALHYFVVHNITWRALPPEKFGHWNSVWKRYWRLSRSRTFEAFFDALAAMSETAHLDRRRICRERKILTAERVEHVNRIKGLLFAQGRL